MKLKSASKTRAGTAVTSCTRIAIRGITGLLGSRLVLAINNSPDKELTVGVARNDPSLHRFLESLRSLPKELRLKLLPTKFYLDEKQRVVRNLNTSQDLVTFESADQLNLKASCDVVLDVTSPGNFTSWEDRYGQFEGPIILQSGEFPRGRLVVSPLVSNSDGGNLYRHGDCILTGTVPVLAALNPFLGSVYLDVLTQFSDKLRDYPTDLRLSSTWLRDDLEELILTGLEDLFDVDFNLLGIRQVPGLSHYTVNLLICLNTPLNGEELRDLFSNKPRIKVVPNLSSTYDLAFEKERLAQQMNPKPVTVFGPDLESKERKDVVRLRLALDYKYLVPLGNLDSLDLILNN